VAGSFRQRLFAIALLTVLVCAAATVAVLVLARITLDERSAHAQDNVSREVERMRGALAAVPLAQRSSAERQSGELTSGYASSAGAAPSNQLVRAALRDSANTDAIAIVERAEPDGTPVLIASARVPGGGQVFALQRVVAGRETRSLRVVILVFAALSLSLIVASLRALRAVERDASALQAALKALAHDLDAPVARPLLRELGDIATGIEALARELARAQEERARLTRELGDRERLAALGRVAAGMAHEVRNPLAAIKLRADLARAQSDTPPAVAQDLADIAAEIARLDRLVSDLLALAGRSPDRQPDVDIGLLVKKRAELLGPWASERGVSIESQGSARANAEPGGIVRAVDNLLRNAVEASPSGAKVEILVLARGAGARVEVADAGPGIPKEREVELFEPFFTTKVDGTGLGLALARAVAESHGGTLSYCRDGDTTRFTLEIA
jgi:signal transduction histidine kinase